MAFNVSHAPQQLQGICRLDQLLLDKAPFQTFPGKATELRCICPYCKGRGKHPEAKKGRTVQATASIFKHREGEGYCFKCIACKEFRNCLYRLAREHYPNGEAVADWYATYRWERLEGAAGNGWSCPLPKKVAKSFADGRADKCRSKKERAAAKVAADIFLSPRNT